jgi:hypothetical protein
MIKNEKKNVKKNVYLLMFYFINIQKNFLQNCFLYFISFLCLCLLNFLFFFYIYQKNEKKNKAKIVTKI